MICTKKSFSVLACVCLVAQASAITPRTSSNDLQPKNAKTKITRAAEFSQKHAVYGAALVHTLATAISTNEKKSTASAAILTKDFIKTGFSCRGWTLANGLAKCLQNRLIFFKKRAQAYNFLRDLGKEFFGSGLSGILIDSLAEDFICKHYKINIEKVLKEDFLNKLVLGITFDAFKTVAASKSDTPLSKALLINLSVHALPNLVSEKSKNKSISVKKISDKTDINNNNSQDDSENNPLDNSITDYCAAVVSNDDNPQDDPIKQSTIVEKNDQSEDNLLELFNQIKLKKTDPFTLFCKKFNYQEDGKHLLQLLALILQQMLLTRITEVSVPCCQPRSSRWADKLAQKLINHSASSLIKTTFNYLPWQVVCTLLISRLNKIRARSKNFLARSAHGVN